MDEKLKKLRLLASTNSKRFLEELRDLIQEWKSLKKSDKKKFQTDIIEMQKIGQDLFEKLYYKKSESNEDVIKAIEKGSQNVFDKSGLKSNVLKVREMLKYIQADEAEKALKVMDNLSSVAKQRGGTILNTLEIGNNRAGVIENAKKRGINKFRYEGPTGALSRDFCKSRVGNVYTIEEIELMDNTQKLPVLYFCGGYNCRHRWVAVENLAKTPENIDAAQKTAEEIIKMGVKEVESVKGWTGTDYISIIRFQRGQIDKNSSHYKIISDKIDVLDKVLTKSPQYNGITYRGVSDCDIQYYKSWKNIGEVKKFDNFTSTTLDPDVAEDFSNSGNFDLLFTIRTKKGVNISGLSTKKHEYEILLDDKQQYKILNVEEINVKFDNKKQISGKLIIKLEAL